MVYNHLYTRHTDSECIHHNAQRVLEIGIDKAGSQLKAKTSGVGCRTPLWGPDEGYQACSLEGVFAVHLYTCK